MPTDLPVSFVSGAFPPNEKMTLQEFADAFAARLRMVTSAGFVFIVAGTTPPTSDVGPFWTGSSWLYWDSTAGLYKPQVLAPASLGYTVGQNPPDPNVYTFWIETNGAGLPLAIKIYDTTGPAWVDVYAIQLATYQTVAAFAAAIASYSTTAQMNAAIAAAIAAAAAAFNSYPAQASNTVPQAVPVDAASHILQLNQALINPSSNFDVATYRYTATVAGFYFISAVAQVDNNTAVAATMGVIVSVYKNGVDTGIGDGDATPSPNGSRWFMGFGGMLVSLAINDYLDLRITLDDGTNTGAVDVSNAYFAVAKVP